MLKLLFTIQGRINRARFWLGSLTASIGGGILASLILALCYAVVPSNPGSDGYNVAGWKALPFGLTVLAYFVLCIWATICLGVKRYHDMDKEGVWILVIFIPVVGSFVYFIQAGCISGTIGPNRYGPDPRHSMSPLSPPGPPPLLRAPIPPPWPPALPPPG